MIPLPSCHVPKLLEGQVKAKSYIARTSGYLLNSSTDLYLKTTPEPLPCIIQNAPFAVCSTVILNGTERRSSILGPGLVDRRAVPEKLFICRVAGEW